MVVRSFRRARTGMYTAAFFALLLGALIPNAAFANTGVRDSVSVPQTELLFEENRGQFRDTVDFVAHGKGYSVAIGPWPVVELVDYGNAAGAQADRPTGSERRNVSRLHLKVLGARAGVQARPMERSAAFTHYLLGSQSEWRTDVANYERVRYAGILPRIDAEYYGRDGRLEYDFVVRPGGDPVAIRLAFDGADGLRIDEQGDLLIRLGDREIVQRAPLSFQLDEEGVRQVVPSAYTLVDNVVGFEVAQWDASRDLVIDPVLEYSAYFGGARFDRAQGLDVDASGNIYVIGTSTSSGLATSGAYQESVAGARVEQVSFPF